MKKTGKSQIEPRALREGFGQLPDGGAAELVRLRGDNGFEARVISYGAAVQSIFVPDRADPFFHSCFIFSL